MANVTMDLAELDQLRANLKQLEIDKQILIDNQQQVIIYHKYFNGKVKTVPVKKENGRGWDKFEVIGMHYDYGRLPSTTCYYGTQSISFQELLDKGLIEIDVTEVSDKTTKDYKNLSEVIAEIKAEEKDALASKLRFSNDKINNLEVELETIKNDFNKKLLRVNKKYLSALQKLNEDNESTVNTQLKEFDSLKKIYKEKLHSLNEDYKLQLITKDGEYVLQLNKKDEEIKSLTNVILGVKEEEEKLSFEAQIAELNKKLDESNLKLIEPLKPKSFTKRLFNN